MRFNLRHNAGSAATEANGRASLGADRGAETTDFYAGSHLLSGTTGADGDTKLCFIVMALLYYNKGCQ